ncbi:YeeE/YedE family protein [Methylicorpusculum oleiharenae]|uniref:DUF6691 family protein n=1 Tax=Methylicorpusculum oleiharenae TaxID=1338687 RepID=UPI001357ABFA|nr:DUF6691 family protein [Methylicorpusculum oleiharenae]MCD2450468.1 YeeE/YedE family protein [Methylicorpusculum oleiharenae]
MLSKNLSAGFSGLIFGFGLTVSQMLNPAKVLNFLDVAGDWDPSLALVMLGALSTLGLSRLWIRKRVELPAQSQPNTSPGIDRQLLLGAAIFGMGWGLSGFCPGPALASLTYGLSHSFVFVTAMFSGFTLFKICNP